MFCRQCGNQLFGDEQFCEACGAAVQDRHLDGIRPKQKSDSMVVPPYNGRDSQAPYRTYEYARTTVKGDLTQVALDCYASLGYELTGERSVSPGNQTTLSFRRSRKVSGKAQLSKIQRSMDDTITSIANMEAQKTKKATNQAIVLGVISTLILGLGMCCIMVWTHLMVLGIIIGIIGIAGCALTFIHYRKTVAEESAHLNPDIEAAYDRLATQCEEAQSILCPAGSL